MRWENEQKFVEIEHVSSVDVGPAIVVSSNAFEGPLPVEWRETIPDTEPLRQEELIASVGMWAARNGFIEVRLD
ncbi:MAG: hypothetical protein AB7U81_11450 [Thiohalomonadaceae bacterium]